MRLARLFKQRPGDVATWTPGEIIAAGSETEGDQPLDGWMPMAMAELVQAVQAFGGRVQTIGEILKRWGFDAPDESTEMTDDQWLNYGRHNA